MRCIIFIYFSTKIILHFFKIYYFCVIFAI